MMSKNTDNFKELLILSFFKSNTDYSFSEIAEYMGLSYDDTFEIIQELISNGELQYQDNLLSLSFKGRLTLQNTPMDNYSCNSEGVNKKKFKLNLQRFSENFYLPEHFNGIDKQ